MVLVTPRAGVTRARITCDDGVVDVAGRLRIQGASKPARPGRSMRAMRFPAHSLILPFLAGCPGWLVIGAITTAPGGGGIAWLILTGTMGILAGIGSRHRTGLVALWLGMLVSYSAMLLLGIILFLGENWWVSLALALALAAIGYLVGLIATAPSSRTADLRR